MSTELDYMEYANDNDAQAAYVTDGVGPGLDSNTKLLMHMEGSDEGTTFADSSIANPKGNATVTADVDTEADQKKWGSTSGQFDGDSGKLVYANSVDWNISTNWTVDFWMRKGVGAGGKMIITHHEDNTHRWFLYIENTVFSFAIFDGTQLLEVTSSSVTFNDDTWYHIALIRKDGQYWGAYVDGTQILYIDDSDMGTFTGNLTIGEHGAGGWNYGGYLDELRIQQSNYFNATPNATPDDTITVPTVAYGSTTLQSYSENTIKTQGSYSLKGIAAQTDSLNDTLTRTVNPTIDLSDLDNWKFDIYSSRTGAQIKLGIRDSGGTTTEITHSISSADTWETVTVDISGVSNANKDAIDRIIITIVNADVANTFYIDNMFAEIAIEGSTAKVFFGCNF